VIFLGGEKHPTTVINIDDNHDGKANKKWAMLSLAEIHNLWRMRNEMYNITNIHIPLKCIFRI
jgi:hypothetical protein